MFSFFNYRPSTAELTFRFDQIFCIKSSAAGITLIASSLFCTAVRTFTFYISVRKKDLFIRAIKLLLRVKVYISFFIKILKDLLYNFVVLSCPGAGKKFPLNMQIIKSFGNDLMIAIVPETIRTLSPCMRW